MRLAPIGPDNIKIRVRTMKGTNTIVYNVLCESFWQFDRKRDDLAFFYANFKFRIDMGIGRRVKSARPKSREIAERRFQISKKVLSENSSSGSTAAFFMVRPAWAHSCGCKSRRKLVTANKAKRNCGIVTGEEYWTACRCGKHRVRCQRNWGSLE